MSLLTRKVAAANRLVTVMTKKIRVTRTLKTQYDYVPDMKNVIDYRENLVNTIEEAMEYDKTLYDSDEYSLEDIVDSGDFKQTETLADELTWEIVDV